MFNTDLLVNNDKNENYDEARCLQNESIMILWILVISRHLLFNIPHIWGYDGNM